MQGANRVNAASTTEDPELAERFDRVLGETVEAMEDAGLHYAFIGGIASGGLGRPRSTHDIDLFVQPEDAELALRALARKGFRTEKTDPSWLYKGFKEDILVDVIFKSKGEIYFDSEMSQRLITAEFHGRQLRLVPPEDLLIIKAAAHSELTPGHWHDAIALLTHANLDWDYLMRRARKAPRRLLSLLLYAQSNDVWVPNHVIYGLYGSIFGGGQERLPHDSPAYTKARPIVQSASAPSRARPALVPPKRPDPYRIAHLRERLAEDARTNELDIQIEHHEGKILLRGEVHAAERRELAEQLAREAFSECQIENQIRVLSVRSPSEIEDVL
jgi:hypothetical protein